MICSRKIRIFTTVFSCLLIGHFLFVACNHITDDVVQKKETSSASSPSDTSQPQGTPTIPPTSNPSSPTNNPPSTTDSSTPTTDNSTSPTSSSTPSAGNTQTPADSSTPSAGNTQTPADSSTPSAGNTQTPADSSTPSNTVWSDYKYYKNLVISKESYQVQAITSYFPEEDEDKIVYLLQELRDTIIPQAVTSLLNRFPKTFAHLKDQEIGMGIALNSNPETSFVASFYANYGCTPGEPDKPLSSMYGLTISYGRLAWETGKHTLPYSSRNELESHVAHEMMHALMSESLTCGFYGINASLGKAEQFPKWFTEGVAEVAGGGARRIWQEINNKYILEQLENRYVIGFLENNPLTGEKDLSAYQTGYLAVMYLAYLAGGGQSMASDSLATGLDILMSEIHFGKTLDQVIKENSENQFNGLEDFQAKFVSTNSNVVDFSTKLLNAIGKGRGSLLTSNYCDEDLLINQQQDTPLFWMYMGAKDTWTNTYNDKVSASSYFKGGAAR